MTYYLYHIPGKKIGITKDLKKRVEKQQGYNEGEYDIILETDDINIASEAEISLQKAFGYRVDETPYNKLKFNKEENDMNINVTEQTTTFPCPVNKLKGQLMDNMGMKWETDHGSCILTPMSIEWIMQNVLTSKYNTQRCYVYNKAFARWFDNNNAYPSNGHTTRTGGLAPTGMKERVCGEPEFSKRHCDDCDCEERTIDQYNQFDLIRKWADERGLYEKGDPKTQALKLVEEVGEISRAIIKDDFDEVIDGIGDSVVVLTNLAELMGVSIEECIASAYGVISKRTGKMVNGTFVKD